MNKSLPLALSLSLIGIPIACGGDDSVPAGAGGAAGTAGQSAGGATSTGSGGAANGGTSSSTGGSSTSQGGMSSSSNGGAANGGMANGGAASGGMPGSGGASGQGGDGSGGAGSARDALCDAICATEAELTCPPADAATCAEDWCTGDFFLEGACTAEYDEYLACLAAADTDAFECVDAEPFPREETCADEFNAFFECGFGTPGGGGAGGQGGSAN